MPLLWKESTVVPVAKGTNPKVLDDFRPMPFQTLIKRDLLTRTEHILDPLQFAYRAKQCFQALQGAVAV